MKRYLRIPFTVIMLILLFALPGRAEHFRGGPGWWPVVGLGLG